jgi:hypothetical protein
MDIMFVLQRSDKQSAHNVCGNIVGTSNSTNDFDRWIGPWIDPSI